MSTHRHAILRDLVEEAKKRLVVLAICVVGLSYLMSLTSSSVLINLPIAAIIIIFFRYFAMDYDMKKKADFYTTNKASATTTLKLPQIKTSQLGTKLFDISDWRKNINSPLVEEAVDHFSRRLVSEWITDLWYSKLTPDIQGPEELVLIINSVVGEFSRRICNINLIDLLTRDLIGVICHHLERFRAIQSNFDKDLSEVSSNGNIDEKLRFALAEDDKLHPALFSDVSQHKVLQHMMDGLITLVFRPEDRQCSLFRYVCRELLASTVMRPVLNMATPRFINERIEIFVLSKRNKAPISSEDVSLTKSDDLPSDDYTKFSDPAGNGVELVQLKNDNPKCLEASNGDLSSKDPLLSLSARSSHSWNSLPLNSKISTQGVVQRHQSVGEWGEILDIVSQRKTAALAPENFEVMWSKGRNHGNPKPSSVTSFGASVSASQVTSEKSPIRKNNDSGILIEEKDKRENHLLSIGADDRAKPNDDTESLSSVSSFSSEGEGDPCNVTGIDSPGTKVWDRKNNRNLTVASIHHPLETPVSRRRRKIVNGSLHYKQPARLRSGRKRTKANSQKDNAWQEVERTSFLSGDGQDILRSNDDDKVVDSNSGSDVDVRISTGATTSTSLSSIMNSATNPLSANSFFRLKCEVLGANIVKGGSKNFAVYSISVIDGSNNNWSIKRRFRHFEELHRRLKEYSEYDLHLPPKHFLSGGLDVYVIQERCQLLDRYLKIVLELPKVSGSIEVWDFLSVDSQTYFFTSSFSVVETLHVNLEDNASERNKNGSFWNSTPGKKEHIIQRQKEPNLKENISESDVSISGHSRAEHRNMLENSVSDSESQKIAKNDRVLREGDLSYNPGELLPNPSGTPFPIEWVPPNVTLPILDLVDVILQLHDGGWIRRKAFWVVKQILQLGMCDALDDWVLDKIQLLRKGSFIASLVKRIETILWPDGIFITKHPKRRAQGASDSPQNSNTSISRSPTFSEELQFEADRRAKFVYELMIDKAPAPIVGLVGRKEYEHCVKDLYSFIQSGVCLKLLVLDILELIIVAAFPEMDATFEQLHHEKHRFGEYIPSSAD